MRIVALAPAMLLLVSVSALHSQPKMPSESRLDDVIHRGVVRIGMPADYLPFGLFDRESGQWQGLDVDEARALGVKLELVKSSWPTLTPDLLEGKFDIAAGGVSISLERQKGSFLLHPDLARRQDPHHAM